MSVFLEILRCILCCEKDSHRESDYDTLERGPLLQSSSYSSAVRSSSYRNNNNYNNNNLPCDSDRATIYYYECYPNLSTSSSATKKPSSVSQQSEYVNKSLNKTDEVSQSLKSSRPSPPSFSYNPTPSPALPQSSSKQTPSCKPDLSFSNFKASTSNRSLSPPKASHTLTQSSSFHKHALASSVPFPSPSGPPPSSSTPILSSSRPEIPPSKALSSVSRTASSSLSQSLASPQAPPSSARAKPPTSLIKPSPSLSSAQSTSISTPASLKAPSSASLIKPSPSLCGSTQSTSMPTPPFPKAPSSSQPTLPPLPTNSTNQKKKVEKGTSPYKTPKDVENLIKKDIVPNVLKKPSSQPTLSPLPTNSTNQQKKDNYVWVAKGSSPYKIPKEIENLIKKDIVPEVLQKPLSPSTYKDYFAALLYAEDFYVEKWSNFQLLNVTLELQIAEIYDKSLKKKSSKGSDKKDDKFFVAFKIDSVPERRPFLLSRDFVFARLSGSKDKKFQGLLYRVVKSTTVLVEFEKDFYSQHRSNRRYDISFSFNRVCLKRAHQAIAAASDSLFKNFLFPDCVSRKNIPSSAPCPYRNYQLDFDTISAVQQILSFEGQPPYLVEGPLSTEEKKAKNENKFEKVLSKTGIVVREAVLKIYQLSLNSRILICAPSNRICDLLIGSLQEDIPESDMFRANAAFREVDGVPYDILPLCLYERKCFTCPPLQDLKQYRVIFSTFVSSFRLYNVGITAGHFSHIFLVDASSSIEPEIMIALSNLANKHTNVIVTGAPHDCSSWVRSDIARKYGLRTSYFERLCELKSYQSLDPAFITQLSDSREESYETCSFLPFY